MSASPQPDPGPEQQLQREPRHEARAGRTRVLRPRTPLEAQQLKDGLGAAAAFVGGGTVLQLAWGEPPPDLTLIDVSGLAQASGIRWADGGLRIGAATRLEALRHDPLVRRHAPLLATACASLAALSVRHLATLGGNVGWRCGDTLAALLVLEARAELADGSLVALADWLAGSDGSLLVALQVPAAATTGGSVFEKVGHRAAFSPTRLALAVHRGAGGSAPRVAVSGAGLAARRLARVEQLLAAAAPVPGPVLAAACQQEFADPSLARLAARLLHGHLETLA